MSSLITLSGKSLGIGWLEVLSSGRLDVNHRVVIATWSAAAGRCKPAVDTRWTGLVNAVILAVLANSMIEAVRHDAVVLR